MAYLSTIKDTQSNEILAYKFSDRIPLDIALDTIKNLTKSKRVKLTDHTFIHSGQGSHYTSPIFPKLLYLLLSLHKLFIFYIFVQKLCDICNYIYYVLSYYFPFGHLQYNLVLVDKPNSILYWSFSFLLIAINFLKPLVELAVFIIQEKNPDFSRFFVCYLYNLHTVSTCMKMF